ncbi:hypothetical protein [Mycobacterium deserti]|uniref:Uncharacterized protein n=1 Tax=Mycobacterium deserti TaxID=2978347 RepID=A0ABT2M6W0_9MYCO|nr:hypothetical protein [Mycobacterium deserti]MCT7658002.1 hypothetical protein [Mycobacterium deserti]
MKDSPVHAVPPERADDAGFMVAAAPAGSAPGAGIAVRGSMAIGLANVPLGKATTTRRWSGQRTTVSVPAPNWGLLGTHVDHEGSNPARHGRLTDAEHVKRFPARLR